ncbi:MAG: metal ABC transporter ATP-binding protein [Neisseriaceae bacterium]|nr:metal ABC transporter ATP-binding protein [Neisseriaceae bacterium]
MKIILENITVSYRRFPAVHHISATFQAGESWAICGPNGAGKSTLLQAIMGLTPVNSGRVTLNSMTLQDIAYMPQLSQIDRSQPLSVFELVAMGLWYEIGFFSGLSKTQKERVYQALERVRMEMFAHRFINELSNGQFQRVLLARVLVQNAKFLLLDEPFNAIDEQTAHELSNILDSCCQQGQGVIAVLHNNDFVLRHFSHTLLMAREMIASGKTHQVLTPEYLKRSALFRQDSIDEEAWCEEKEDA